MATLADSLVLKFINAKTEDALREFMGEFGLPVLKPETQMRVDLRHVLESRQILQNCRRHAEVGEAKTASLIINRAFENDHLSIRPRLEYVRGELVPSVCLHAANLYSFMLMEMSVIVAGGEANKFLSCENCGRIFLTGHNTGRRSSSQFCSERCRVARRRARFAMKAEAVTPGD